MKQDTKIIIICVIIMLIFSALFIYYCPQQIEHDIYELTEEVVNVITLDYAFGSASLVTFGDGTSLKFNVDDFGQFYIYKGKTVHITYYWLVNTYKLESIEEVN